jgi:hypothetical protein
MWRAIAIAFVRTTLGERNSGDALIGRRLTNIRTPMQARRNELGRDRLLYFVLRQSAQKLFRSAH